MLSTRLSTNIQKKGCGLLSWGFAYCRMRWNWYTNHPGETTGAEGLWCGGDCGRAWPRVAAFHPPLLRLSLRAQGSLLPSAQPPASPSAPECRGREGYGEAELAGGGQGRLRGYRAVGDG